MSYKNKHIVHFGLSDDDYQLMVDLFNCSGCSSYAQFFRLILRLNSKGLKINISDFKSDINLVRSSLYECLGVIKNES